MVRKCIVPGCPHNDLSILSHRFPRRTENASLWMEALGIMDIPIPDLINKYVVCTKHFKKSDYRNAVSNSLNYTACPSLDTDSIEVIAVTQTTVTPPAVDIVDSPSNTYTLVSRVPARSPKISLKRIPNPIVIKKHRQPVPETTTTIITLECEPLISVIDISENEEYDNTVTKNGVIEINENFDNGEHEEIVIVDPPYQSVTNDLLNCHTQQTKKSLPSHVLQLYPTSLNKRKRSSTPPKSKLKTLTHSSMQTDAAIISVETEEIEKNYSEYKDLSKLDLIKQLKEKDQKILELEAKTEKLKQIIQNW
jgi:hypothetical protein